jgi:hypothetical protein
MGFETVFALEDDELYEKKVFRDVIHDYIHVDHLIIWQLINSEQMQRLRRIKQLGGTYQVFHSAEHSRFGHSLGVYEIVRKMINSEFMIKQISDYDKLCVMCAALLHDIGHGPFSHSFECIFDNNHEEMTIRMILEDSDVHRILVSYDKNLPKDIASIINKTHPNQLLIQMISSQLDCDRMDYLLRDSYMTGTTYGHFDLSRILRTMRIQNHKIVYKESGVHAIENYILARYYMYWQVYYHSSARSFEHLLRSIFLRIKDLYKDNYQFKTNIHYLVPFLNNQVTVKDYTLLDESVLEYYFKEFIEEDDIILADLSYRFLNRKLFKYKELDDGDEERIKNIALLNNYDPRYYVFTDIQKQVPYRYEMNDRLDEIEIVTHQGLLPLPEVSEIVNAIVKSDKYKEDHKIFFPKEIKNGIQNI